MAANFYSLNQIAEPNDDVIIMQYMPLWKYLYLVVEKRTALVRSDLFEDKYEGIFPKANEVNGFLPGNLNYYKNLKKWIYLSCWFMNPYESEAMWRLYTKENDGILLKTTYGKFKRSFNTDLFIGVVKYIDYETEIKWDEQISDILPFFFKRNSMEHEKEIRLLLKNVLTGDDGQTKLVNHENTKMIEPRKFEINNTADYIMTTPFSNPNFHKLVKAISESNGISSPILESKIYKTNFFKQ